MFPKSPEKVQATYLLEMFPKSLYHPIYEDLLKM
jgi:hypothetical protein